MCTCAYVRLAMLPVGDLGWIEMDSKKQASTPLLNWFFRSLALFIPPPQLHALHDDNHRPDDGGGGGAAAPVAVRPMVVLVVVVDSVQPASFISA